MKIETVARVYLETEERAINDDVDEPARAYRVWNRAVRKWGADMFLDACYGPGTGQHVRESWERIAPQVERQVRINRRRFKRGAS